MSTWKKIAISGSNADVKSLYLSGTNDGTTYIANPNYYPTASDLHLANFTGDNDAWKTNEDNLNDNLTTWTSSTRTVINYDGTTSLHQGFDVSGLSPVCLPITLIGSSNIGDGEAWVQNSTMLFIEAITQNGEDITSYFQALVGVNPGSLTYTLTDGVSNAIYTIDQVEVFNFNNVKLTGTSVNGVSLLDLNLGSAEICLPLMGYEQLTTGTGPNHGVIPYQNTSTVSTQTTGQKYLYAETSDPGEHTYSITSPFIDLQYYIHKKLIFFFHLHGNNCGEFKVYTSADNLNILNGLKAMTYSNWPGANGAFPNSVEVDNHWSGGSLNTSDVTFKVGPGEVQEEGTSPFNRVEVDLSSFTSGYIWIVYESGNPGIDLGDSPEDAPKADFAIGNLFLDLDGYTQPIQFAEVAETPTLEVKFDHVRFVNLPVLDPGVLGALYKDPSNLTGIRSQVRISNGP